MTDPAHSLFNWFCVAIIATLVIVGLRPILKPLLILSLIAVLIAFCAAIWGKIMGAY